MKSILSTLFTLVFALVLSGCSKEEPHSINPSPRDGVYEGKNLTVTLDGKPLNSVKSVRVLSEIIGYGYDENMETDESNPIYHSIIMVNGFPVRGEETRFTTVSDLRGFEGTMSVNNANSPFPRQNYEYAGTFTGNAFESHDLQGLILEFTSIDNTSNNPE